MQNKRGLELVNSCSSGCQANSEMLLYYLRPTWKKNMFLIQQVGKKNSPGWQQNYFFVKSYNFTISQNSLVHLHIVVPFMYWHSFLFYSIEISMYISRFSYFVMKTTYDIKISQILLFKIIEFFTSTSSLSCHAAWLLIN